MQTTIFNAYGVSAKMNINSHRTAKKKKKKKKKQHHHNHGETDELRKKKRRKIINLQEPHTISPS